MPAGPNQVLMTGSACHKILLIYRVVCLWEEEKVERQRQRQRQRELQTEKTTFLGLLSFGKLQTPLFSAISLSELGIPGQPPSPGAHSSLSWLGVCFTGDCLIQSYSVHRELSTMWDSVQDLGKSGLCYSFPLQLDENHGFCAPSL